MDRDRRTFSAEDDEEDDSLDIFRDLDINLLDLAIFGNRVDYFLNIPLSDHNDVLDRLNHSLSNRLEQLNRNDRMFEFYFSFGIPFINIHYDQVRRRLTYKQFIRGLRWLAQQIVDNIRAMAIKICLVYMYSSLFIFGSSVIMSSDNWLKDVYTYLFGNTYLIETCGELWTNGNDPFYFIDDDTLKAQSKFSIVKRVLENWLALRLSVVGFEHDDGGKRCLVSEKSLVFRFSKTIEKHFGFLSISHVNKLSTLAMYFAFFYYSFVVSNSFRELSLSNIMRRAIESNDFLSPFFKLCNRLLEAVT